MLVLCLQLCPQHVVATLLQGVCTKVSCVRQSVISEWQAVLTAKAASQLDGLSLVLILICPVMRSRHDGIAFIRSALISCHDGLSLIR